MRCAKKLGDTHCLNDIKAEEDMDKFVQQWDRQKVLSKEGVEEPEFKDCPPIEPGRPERCMPGKPPHGISRGGIKNAVGSFWIMKKDLVIHGIGGSTGGGKENLQMSTVRIIE